jgi:hypothetical protein
MASEHEVRADAPPPAEAPPRAPAGSDLASRLAALEARVAELERHAGLS